MLSNTEIQNILAHRYPFLLVDRIIELEPLKYAVGIKNVTINEPFFEGHFPGKPIMPGALLLEAMSQVGGVAVLYEENNRGVLAYTAGFNKVKFRKNVVPGDQLKIIAKVIRLRTSIGKVRAEAFVDGEKAVEAEIIFKYRVEK
ncbi:MAG: (3R)-hydroxymyristoyl-(acyl-carrier-protein) dehydratase [Firmicutes bacterium]|nr:(3R)-hydroxymyristoyl-(acyl-carrier-protein) dehydratase [Bacillota bacterium]